MAGLLDFLSIRDMFDGGGAGASGSTFEGGSISELLNKLGIKPLGSMQGMDQARPMARPAGLGPAPRPMAAPAPAMAPQPSPYAPGAITQTTLPPMGAMGNDELIRMLMRALNQNSSVGYGPR